MRFFILISLCCGLAISAYAAEEPKGTKVSLSAQAESWLANDELIVTFRISAEGNNADKLRQQVNRKSKQILKRLRREKLKVSTTGRRMEEVRDYKRRIRTGWRLTQTGQIVSEDLDAVAAWLGDIESIGVELQGIQYGVSSKARRKAANRLRLQAISGFRAKARLVAGALDASTFRIINLRTSSPKLPRPAPFRAMSMTAEKAQPALSVGESHLVIEVSGSIEVPFRDFKAE
ncbi:MAG: SIMPL domain-containing protein [Mariprofundaceae bacterium]